MNRRPRKLVQFALFLLLGAIVNVAVAWGCALVVDAGGANNVHRGVEATAGGNWEVFRLRRFGTERVQSLLFGRGIAASTESADEVLPRWCALDARLALETMRPFPPAEGPTFEARGWPLVSLSQTISIVSNVRRNFGSLDVGLPDFNGKVRCPRLMPLRPIWPGFAINTIFYAAVLWVLWFAVPVAARRYRRARRIKRGLCPSCGYNLKGLTAPTNCPECGSEKQR